MADHEALVGRVMNECVAALLATVPGMTHAQAQQTVREMAQKAYERACERSRDIYTEGHGNDMLRRESTDPSLRAALQKRRAEGVTDDDIRWWWNMSAFEQEMIVQQDEMNRTALYLNIRERISDPAEAARQVFKHHEKYGDPAEGTGDDRPLPYELKHRIVSYIERVSRDPQELLRRMEYESSFNALVRKEIRNGNV